MQTLESTRLPVEEPFKEISPLPVSPEIIAEVEASTSPRENPRSLLYSDVKAATLWLSFWLTVWLGTTLSGGVFGLGVAGLFAIPGIFTVGPASLLMMLYGGFFGLLWAGGVGLVITPTIACLCWILGFHRSPGILATLTGGLIGLLSMPPMFLFTAPIGSFGGWLGARVFANLLGEERFTDSNHNDGGRFNFTIRTLMMRTLAVALLITYWMAVIDVVASWLNY